MCIRDSHGLSSVDDVLGSHNLCVLSGYHRPVLSGVACALQSCLDTIGEAVEGAAGNIQILICVVSSQDVLTVALSLLLRPCLLYTSRCV